MTALRRLVDIDAELMAVHARYLDAERRGDLLEASDEWDKLDALLEQRAQIPQQRAGD